jgi:DUF2075 family protein
MDKPGLIHKEIIKKNATNNKSRMLAGYCWKWISRTHPNLKDIVIDDYSATWNLNQHGQSWIIHPNSVSEVGCIHTCQGLELDYAGIIIGPDLIVRNGKIITDGTKRASTDRSLWGLTQQIRNGESNALATADMVIKNTYRTLMTRGMKGCYIYCTDSETQEYFRSNLKATKKGVGGYGDISDGISISSDAS